MKLGKLIDFRKTKEGFNVLITETPSSSNTKYPYVNTEGIYKAHCWIHDGLVKKNRETTNLLPPEDTQMSESEVEVLRTHLVNGGSTRIKTFLSDNEKLLEYEVNDFLQKNDIVIKNYIQEVSFNGNFKVFLTIIYEPNEG